MTPKRVAPGIYKRKALNGEISYYERPKINGRWTFRKLPVANLEAAKLLRSKRRTDQGLASAGLASDPYAHSVLIREILLAWEKAGCPYRKLKPRHGKALEEEKRRIKNLLPHFGALSAESITHPHLESYAKGRLDSMATIKKARGGQRTIDLEIQTLSNAINFAHKKGWVRFNPLRENRHRFYEKSQARHCRDCRPLSGDEFHKHAAVFFRLRQSEVLAWLHLFVGMAGVRINEAMRLRTDAPPGQPGSVEGDHLWIRRSKGGVNPWVVMTPALKQWHQAFRSWRATRKLPEGPFFPNRDDNSRPLAETALNRALKRSSKEVCPGQPRTAHGLRAFFTTVWRSKGKSNEQIAAMLGDVTASLIDDTYGAIPPNWQGGRELDFLPRKTKPAWSNWLPVKTPKTPKSCTKGLIMENKGVLESL